MLVYYQDWKQYKHNQGFSFLYTLTPLMCYSHMKSSTRDGQASQENVLYEITNRNNLPYNLKKQNYHISRKHTILQLANLFSLELLWSDDI